MAKRIANRLVERQPSRVEEGVAEWWGETVAPHFPGPMGGDGEGPEDGGFCHCDEISWDSNIDPPAKIKCCACWKEWAAPNNSTASKLRSIIAKHE